MPPYTYSTSIVPSGWSGSSYLNPVVRTYEDLLRRTKLQLGWPIVNVEALDCAIYDNINIAIEMYSRYAGFTEEYLMFDSNQYVKGVGIQMDAVFSSLGATFRTETSAVSGRFFDYDIEDYRKVLNVFTFDPVEYSGTDVLFTLDYVFAAQTYFNYMQSFGGFDLVTWQVLKEWLELRQKMFATQPQFIFDQRRQTLRLIPEPNGDQRRYVGIIGAYVEKPIRDILPEQWVQKYTLALTKIMTGNIRGKITGATLLGGATINYNDLLSQGLEEKKQLEDDLLNKPGEAPPLGFFVG
jgi:hypothetical protein